MHPMIAALSQAVAQQTGHLAEHPEEGGIWLAIAGTVAYIVRHWFQSRKFRAAAKEFEKKLENDPESSLAVAKNPGRTSVELLEILHSDLTEFKRATNLRLDKLTEEVGYLKGRLNGPK